VAAVFNVVLPVALIVLIGFVVGRRITFDLGTLSKLSLYILAPALSFNSMYKAQLGAGDAAKIFLSFGLSTLILILVARGVGTLTRQNDAGKRSLVATTIFPNVGNFGLSLTLFALGDAGLERGLVTFAAGGLLTFGLGPALVSGQGFRKGIKTTARLPMIWALLVGVSLRSAGIELPTGVASSIDLLAGATIPLLLILLGLQISQSKISVERTDWVACVLRLGIGPIAAYTAGRVVGLDPLALKVLVLQCCTPTAVNALLVSAEFGGDARKAARIVVLTSLLSLATVPIVMWLMGIG
jgi:predicted permease